MTESHNEAYARGEDAGRIAQQLESHEKHLNKINGSMERVADELHKLRLTTQRLADQATAAAANVIVVAEALAAADKARRAKSDSSWSPLARAGVAIGAVVGLFTLYYFVFGLGAKK